MRRYASSIVAVIRSYVRKLSINYNVVFSRTRFELCSLGVTSRRLRLPYLLDYSASI